MYETADMMGANKRAIVNELLREYRAGLIPETPEHNKDSKPAAKRAAAAAPLAKRPATQATSQRAKKISSFINETARKIDDDIRRLQEQKNPIIQQIAELARADKSGNGDAIAALRNQLDALQAKIDTLAAARKKLG